MIELLYILISVPVILVGLHIILEHDSMGGTNLNQNYPFIMYITLLVWWIVLSVYFISPQRHGSEATMFLDGNTLMEFVSMIGGYCINIFVLFLATKEMNLNFGGIFRSRSGEELLTVAEEVKKYMMTDAVREEVGRLAALEIKEHPEQEDFKVARPTEPLTLQELAQ